MFTNINPYKHNHIPADQEFSIQQQIKQQYALQIPEVLRYWGLVFWNCQFSFSIFTFDQEGKSDSKSILLDNPLCVGILPCCK